MAAYDDLFDLTIRHSIGLERYKNKVVEEVIKLLNATENDLEEQLIYRLEQVAAFGYDTGPAVTKRIAKMMDDVSDIREDGYDALVAYLKQELSEFAAYEFAWQIAVLEEVIPIELSLAKPTAEMIHSAIYSKPFNGHVMKDWVEGMAPADIARIQRVIQMGVTEGKTVQEMTRAIFGSREAGFSDGALAGSRRGAEAVARTAVNHVSTQAREMTYAANTDIISKVRWISTIDGRTTLICISRDQKLYGVQEGPRPPAHWKCRSTTLPVIDGIAIVANRPTVTDTRDRRSREIDFRAEAKKNAGSRWSEMSEAQRRKSANKERQIWAEKNIGSVSGKTSYQDWLRKQPASFQDEVLGKARGKLFRERGMTVDKFSDASGKKYTLKQLREFDAETFKKAKL